MTLSKTFRRVEDKYIISREQMDRLLNLAGNKLRPDKYPTSNMHNLYFDTKNYDLIIRANDSEPFRKKFRVRSYVEPRENSDVFVEIKTKLKKNGRKISGKRRFSLKLADFERYLATDDSFEGLLKNMAKNENILQNLTRNIQIAREADYLINFFDLIPQVFVAYDRESYSGDAAHNDNLKDKDAFRVTFDKNLRYRTDNLGLFINNKETSYFKKGNRKNIIMEVKTLGSMPLWFVQILSKLEIFPQPFSKYGRIYQQIKEEANV